MKKKALRWQRLFGLILCYMVNDNPVIIHIVSI